MADGASETHDDKGLGRAARVCVTMPVYNGERYLLEALESIFSQDYPDVVVRVVDNASTDGTRALLRQIPDPRLQVVLHDEHVPVGGSYARAAEQHCGAYMLFLAADDRLAPGALAALVETAEAHPECGFVFGRTVVLHEGSRTRPFGMATRPARIGSIEDVETYVLRNGYNIPLSTILFRADAPGFRIDPSTRNACDLDLLLRLGRHGAKAFGIARPVLFLREHDDALSDNGRMLAESTLDTLIHLQGTHEHALYRFRARRVLLWAVVSRLLADDRAGGREMFQKYREPLGLSSRSAVAWLLRAPWLRLPLLLSRRILKATSRGIAVPRRREVRGFR